MVLYPRLLEFCYFSDINKIYLFCVSESFVLKLQ